MPTCREHRDTTKRRCSSNTTPRGRGQLRHSDQTLIPTRYKKTPVGLCVLRGNRTDCTAPGRRETLPKATPSEKSAAKLQQTQLNSPAPTEGTCSPNSSVRPFSPVRCLQGAVVRKIDLLAKAPVPVSVFGFRTPGRSRRCSPGRTTVPGSFGRSNGQFDLQIQGATPPPPENKPRPDICSDLGALKTPRRSDPLSSPLLAPPCSSGTLGPTAGAHLGHLTGWIPPPALRSSRGRSGGRTGRGGAAAGGWGRRRRGPRQRRGGNARADAPAAVPLSLFPRDREIASRQPINCSSDRAWRGGCPEVLNYSFRPCAERSNRRPSSTGWRESQKASSASGQNGRCAGVAVGVLHARSAAARLSPRRRCQCPFRRLCEPRGHGTGLGGHRRRDPGPPRVEFLPTGRPGPGGAVRARSAGASRSAVWRPWFPAVSGTRTNS